MLEAIIAVVFLVVVAGPILVIVLMNLTGGETKASRAAKSRAQTLHDLALSRAKAGYAPDPHEAIERSLLLDELAARFPRSAPLPPSRRALYEHLTAAELAELVKL